MASVNSDSGMYRTEAKKLLDFALGEKRIKLGDLSANEFDTLISKIAYDVDLRELRGFKPLRQFLEFHSSSNISNVFGTNRLELDPNVAFSQSGFKDRGIDLDNHVLSVSRGLRKAVYTHKRYESQEETTDLVVAHRWGNDCYLYKASMETLVLRRPRDHSCADENLAIIRYSYQKVLDEERHLVDSIEVARLPIENFRKYYGKKYAEEATTFIWELCAACSRTQRELESQAESFGKRLAKLERLGAAICY